MLKPYADYDAEHQRVVAELLAVYPLGLPIVGEAAQKASVALFGQLLRLRNILTAFDEFTGHDLLTERQFQDYRSVYLDIYAEFRAAADAAKESINDDVVFEIELIKQVEVDVETRDRWHEYVVASRDAELGRIIADEGLHPAETRAFVADALRDGAVPTTGTAIIRILPPASRFARGGGHAEKEHAVLERLRAYVDRRAGLP